MGKKLNLKWVTEVIFDDYKKWKAGDVIYLEAQTGTGKTFFITGNDKINGLVDNMNGYEKMVYICNRTELKRQIKIDLLRKYGEKIPYQKNKDGSFKLDGFKNYVLDNEALDSISNIGNIVVTSYHAISHGKLENIYNGANNNIDNFDYIVCDECHFFLTDSGYNNKCYLAFEELITTRHMRARKIFISATMYEVEKAIESSVERIKAIGFGSHKDCKLYKYTTGRDYSFLDVKYFKKIITITQLIKNDKTEEKWIIFVTSKDAGEKIEEELKKDGISSTFIYSGMTNGEKKRITLESKFYSKVLISTKCLDNGINIKDETVKNMVIMSYDKTTFIQELGRVRFRIDDAPNINLYIPTMYRKTFVGKIDENYQPKIDDIKLFEESSQNFRMKYNNDTDKVPRELFYLDEKDNSWKINKMGYVRVHKDKNFALDIIDKFNLDGKFDFVKEQLSWVELEGTFDESNFIDNVIDDAEIETLKMYLENLIGEKVLEDNQTKIKEMLTSEAYMVDRSLLQGIKKMHPDTVNSILEKTLKLPYKITATITSRRVEGKPKKYTYWTILKTLEKYPQLIQ